MFLGAREQGQQACLAVCDLGCDEYINAMPLLWTFSENDRLATETAGNKWK